MVRETVVPGVKFTRASYVRWEGGERFFVTPLNGGWFARPGWLAVSSANRLGLKWLGVYAVADFLRVGSCNCARTMGAWTMRDLF